MTPQDLDKVKMIQLEIMDCIHRLCVNNGLNYYIIGGTLLGAVRHKGFIPWDVDIDIAMPRADYDQLRKLCVEQELLNDRYYYCDYLTKKNYPRPHAIICAKNTKIYLKHDALNKYTEQTGVYIDVFPLDNAPDDEKLRERQMKRLTNLRLFKAYRMPYSYSYKKYKILAHRCVAAALSIVSSIDAINKRQHKEMLRYNGMHTECLCSMASKYSYEKQCMPREIFGTPVALPFEGREYFAPEKHTEYLARIFGNYMELPPLEKRQANFDIYAKVEYFSESSHCDFDKQ